MTTACKLLVEGNPVIINGVRQKNYVEASDPRFNANFSTYGGTERLIDGVYAVEDTAEVVTWFRPDITSGARIVRLEDGAMFEIIGEPEDYEQRHQIVSFKVRRLKGGV